MEPLRKFSVFSQLPESLESLNYLARNYWFEWNTEIEELFRSINPTLWETCDHNPVWVLSHTPQERLNYLGGDPAFTSRLNRLVQAQKHYVEAPCPHTMGGAGTGPDVAYFSLEFGVSKSLPIYSGGLGILAGDHLKSASDLNVPLIGVGLAYSEGYFRQYLTVDGWQQERYPEYDYSQMPLQQVVRADKTPVRITCSIGRVPVVAQLFKAKVGRISLYLLDTNIPENPQDLRQITARLYSGNLEMRLRQEILLGIGGVRALRELGLAPSVVHMNEGHCAFAALERIRLLMQEHGLTFDEARGIAMAGSVFTTHTPVPAGNDRFPPALMEAYFSDYARELGLSFGEFLGLGRESPLNESEDFCMTVLALRCSWLSNGVSKLHGQVSRKMWHKIWPNFPEADVPIGAVTNGVHAPTWVAPEMRSLYDRYLDDNWREGADLKVWDKAKDIPDIELWRAHERQRARLVDFIRARLYAQKQKQGARASELEAINDILNPEALTIGFARRFATYKRAQLLLHDIESLRRLVGDTNRPVQFVFAGKAHPADNEGKQLMKDIITLSRSDAFRMHMVFLEDYDMEIASYMISGCDVWLNNPRRPLEACGTSGMKAMFNGVLQFSTLDGWWAEAWTPDNSCGWAIGEGEEYEDAAYQDSVELQTLYRRLEFDIVPEFYDRSRGGMPASWVRRMKTALSQFGPRFHSHRMVQDYLNTAYMPACAGVARMQENDFALAKELSAWHHDILEKWRSLSITQVGTEAVNASGALDGDDLYVGQMLKVTARVFMAGIAPEHIRVDIYAGPLGHDDSFIDRYVVPMIPEGPQEDGWQHYKGLLHARRTGRLGFQVRAMPSYPLMPDASILGLVRWAE